jgi:hypothetical protein
MTTGTSETQTKQSFLSGLFQDLKERLLKWGAVRGLVLIPLGVVGIWIVMTNFKFILHALAALVFVSAIVEGLYQLFHNPIKKQAALNDLVALRMDTEDFLAHLSRLATKKFGVPTIFTETSTPAVVPPIVSVLGAVPQSDPQAVSTAASVNSTISSTTPGSAGVIVNNGQPQAVAPTKQLGITGTN